MRPEDLILGICNWVFVVSMFHQVVKCWFHGAKDISCMAAFCTTVSIAAVSGCMFSLGLPIAGTLNVICSVEWLIVFLLSVADNKGIAFLGLAIKSPKNRKTGQSG